MDNLIMRKLEDIESLKQEIIHEIRKLDDFVDVFQNEIKIVPCILYREGMELRDGTTSLKHFVEGHSALTKQLEPERKAAAAVTYCGQAVVGYTRAKELACFTDDASSELQRLYNIADKDCQDDVVFIVVYQAKTINCGLISYIKPHIFVLDLYDEVAYKRLAYNKEKMEFFIESDGDYSIRKYQLADISDMLTVGVEIWINPAHKDEDAANVHIDRAFQSRIHYTGFDNLDQYTLHLLTEKTAEHALEVYSKLPKERIRVCKLCGKHFVMADSEIGWFEMKNFKLPIKCRACRETSKRVRQSSIQHWDDDPDGGYWL